MANNKQGLDFFKYQVGLLKDRKFRRAKTRYGALAVLVYLAALELIYRDKGYYVALDEDLIWELQDCLQGPDCPDGERVRGVLAALGECGVFDPVLLKRGILTSRRIQREYYNATVERKFVEVDLSLWLLSREEMEKMSTRSAILDGFSRADGLPKEEQPPALDVEF